MAATSESTYAADNFDIFIFGLMSIHSAPLEGVVLEAGVDLEDKTDNIEEKAEVDAEDALDLCSVNLTLDMYQTEP